MDGTDCVGNEVEDNKATVKTEFQEESDQNKPSSDEDKTPLAMIHLIIR